ncbi:MAG: nucleoside-diphosphate kinase [Candidatus Margulisbacteria bacterium]|nr:nucleoside-diphosphate kinase [Candidatus Margulisiibacteriota bacterium]
MNNSKDQYTLVLIKPDGLKKSLTGNILTRLSETKLTIVGAKVVKVSEELAKKHYAHLKDKPFFGEVVKYLCGENYGDRYRRVLALVYCGENAIQKVRMLAGATNPEEADHTTIRGQYGRITSAGLFENVVHCSANEEEATQEIKLWFEPEEFAIKLFPAIEKEVNIKKLFWKK